MAAIDDPQATEDTNENGERRGLSRIAIGVAALLAVVVVVVAVTTLLSGDDDADTATAAGGATGEPAPDVEFELIEGGTLRISDFEGQPLVVNFWASWCAPCIREMPEFEEVHQELGDRVAFLGLNVSDREADALRLIDQTGVTYQIGIDRVGDIVNTFGGLAMPTTAFVTADGELVEVFSGALTKDSLQDMIDEHLLT